jgi:aconitate hydratase
VPEAKGAVFPWSAQSTYITEPPYFDGFGMQLAKSADITGARALAIFGDFITTDHISPSSQIKLGSPAGDWLTAHGSKPADFSHFGTRRCNHEIMVRGTFVNVRIKNLMVPGVEGGVTAHQPSGERMAIFHASEHYRASGVPLIVFAGDDYGMGSSRDWAAKGPHLLGVKTVIAKSFERIHRANLVGMGVLPCQFQDDDSVHSLGIDGTETFDLVGVAGELKPRQDVTLVIHRKDGTRRRVTLTLRIDIGIEVDYMRHGGILPYVLRQILATPAN